MSFVAHHLINWIFQVESLQQVDEGIKKRSNNGQGYLFALLSAWVWLILAIYVGQSVNNIGFGDFSIWLSFEKMSNYWKQMWFAYSIGCGGFFVILFMNRKSLWG